MPVTTHLLGDQRGSRKVLSNFTRHQILAEYRRIRSNDLAYPLITLIQELATQFGASYNQVYGIVV